MTRSNACYSALVMDDADAGEILTLQRAAYVTEAQAHQALDLPPLTQSHDELLVELGDPDVIALGVRDHGRLVGAVRIRLCGRVAEVGRLTVAPDRQGKGVGSFLLAAAEAVFPQVKEMRLFTGEHSTANLRLYKRSGYVETRRTTSGDYSIVHLSKMLSLPVEPPVNQKYLLMDYASALSAVVSWAIQEPNVRAVILTGSAAANAEHPLSDRDLELHVQQTEPLETSDDWWSSLGDVLAVERLKNGEDQPTRLVYYVGGKLDFTLIRTDEDRGLYDRPFTVLLDKDHAARDFTLAPRAMVGPDQEMLEESFNWAGAAVLMASKAIIRDEPWSVMIRDADFKSELLRMIEWDHILRYGPHRDVRYLGTRLRSWMDIDIQQALNTCSVAYGDDNRAALLEGTRLYGRLLHKVATRGGLTPLPFQRIEEEVLRILSSSDGA